MQLSQGCDPDKDKRVTRTLLGHTFAAACRKEKVEVDMQLTSVESSDKRVYD